VAYRVVSQIRHSAPLHCFRYSVAEAFDGFNLAISIHVWTV
jgi:hypothetical protein